MNRHSFAFSLLFLACAALSACQDRRDPVKPTVAAPAAAPPAGF